MDAGLDVPTRYPVLSHSINSHSTLLSVPPSPSDLQTPGSLTSVGASRHLKQIPPYWVARFVFWLLLFQFFLWLEFGAVFFILSCFYAIYRNTSTEPRRPGQLSAYGVFNRNHQELPGALTADQLERNLGLRH